MNKNKRIGFASKLGAILAAAGSAVGLGNIWRFPYETGNHGGAAFILIYLACVFMMGLPIMIAEFTVGRHAKASTGKAFNILSPGTQWKWLGYLGVLSGLLILGYYSVVAGWTLEYIMASLTGTLSCQEPEEFISVFQNFSQDPFRPLVWLLVFLLLTHFIVVKGVRDGIERFSKVMMPMLFILIIVLAIASLLLPGASKGVDFLLAPDFSKVNADVFLSAMGQAFFSLSLGMGCLSTYASYFSSDTHIGKTALSVGVIDTLVAILAGLIIFPAAFSVGIRGSDVKNEDEIEKFHRTLKLLASSDEKATEVQNMAEVNAKFQEIAEQLNRSTNLQTVTLKMPGISNGTRIRFTFDNVSSAELSELYIEGTFNLRSRTLTDVEYHGMTSTSGTTITGVTEGIFVSFTFEGIHTEGNKLLSMDFVDEWYLVSTSSWQINSEFDRDDQPEIINEQSSAVIMLVLDCSSSLGDQFPMVQANAKSFIATLCSSSNSGESGEGETPEKPLPTLYSTTPVDLSLAVSYNGVRYYLTQEQYAKANLSDAIIEGVTVITGDESFIIAMENEPTDYMASSYARKYYGDNLPSKSQGEVISARWSYINNAIKAFGGTEFSTKFWTSYYTSDYDYYTYAGGGNIGYYYYYGDRGEFPVRLVYPTTVATPIVWRDPLDLSLAVRKDSVMTYYTQTEWADVIDKTEYEIVGVSVSTDTIKFIVAMQNEPADDMLASNAREYYGDNLPTESQGRVISARWSYINNAIKAFGGTEFSTRFWTSYYSGSYSYCTRAGGGSLLSRYDENEYKHPVRLVYPFEEPTKE